MFIQFFYKRIERVEAKRSEASINATLGAIIATPDNDPELVSGEAEFPLPAPRFDFPIFGQRGGTIFFGVGTLG